MVYFLYLPHPIKAHACGLELHHLPSYLCFRQSAGNRSVSRYICLSDWVAASSDSPPVCRHSAYGTSVSEPRIKRWRWVLERSRHQMFEQSNSFFFTTYIKYWRDEIGVLSRKKKKQTWSVIAWKSPENNLYLAEQISFHVPSVVLKTWTIPRASSKCLWVLQCSSANWTWSTDS